MAYSTSITHIHTHVCTHIHTHKNAQWADSVQEPGSEGLEWNSGRATCRHKACNHQKSERPWEEHLTVSPNSTLPVDWMRIYSLISKMWVRSLITSSSSSQGHCEMKMRTCIGKDFVNCQVLQQMAFLTHSPKGGSTRKIFHGKINVGNAVHTNPFWVS